MRPRFLDLQHTNSNANSTYGLPRSGDGRHRRRAAAASFFPARWRKDTFSVHFWLRKSVVWLPCAPLVLLIDFKHVERWRINVPTFCLGFYEFDVLQMKLERKSAPIYRAFQSLTCVARSWSRIYLQSETNARDKEEIEKGESPAWRIETRGWLLQGHDNSVSGCRARVGWRMSKITGPWLLG
jgi:hypothetical protein